MTVVDSEKSATGAEKAHFRIYLVEATTDEDLIGEDLAGTMLVEIARNAIPREMEKFETSVIGSEKDLFRLLHSQNEHHERAVAQERMTAPDQKASAIVDHPLPLGANVHRALKMAHDHPDASSKSDRSLSVPLPRLSRTTNGAPRCDLMPLPQLRSLRYLPAMAVKLHLLLLPVQLSLSADRN